MSKLGQGLKQIITRLTKYLERQKIIARDSDQDFKLKIPEEDIFSRLQASSVTYRFAIGPSKGKKAIALKSVPDSDHFAKSGLVVDNSGFSLHAGVTINPVDFSTSAVQTSGGENLPGGYNGIYSRFQQLPRLKGLVIYPAYSSNLWFLATE